MKRTVVLLAARGLVKERFLLPYPALVRRRLQRFASGWTVLLLLAAAIAVQGQAPISPLLDPRRNSGQNVGPVFEGWEPNPDGTFSLYFGYMNRNWQEEVDIPIGPNNFFAPGPEDRGQPTHFFARRYKKAFGIVVPKDFGDKTLVWTLSIRGSTQQVSGGLKRVSQIDVSKQPLNNNTPPKIVAGPDQTIVFPQPATLRATVSDDGIGSVDRGRQRRGPGLTGELKPRLTVEWREYRGPGRVTFSSTTPAVPPDSRQFPPPGPRILITEPTAVITARFSEPGIYVVQALADDGSHFDGPNNSGQAGYNCCWTTALVTITVKPGPTPVSQR